MWPNLRSALCQNKEFPKKVWFCCWGSFWWDWLIWGLTCRIWTNEWSACLWDSLPRIPVWFLGNLYLPPPHTHAYIVAKETLTQNLPFHPFVQPSLLFIPRTSWKPDSIPIEQWVTHHSPPGSWAFERRQVSGSLRLRFLAHSSAMSVLWSDRSSLTLDIRCHSTPFCGKYPWWPPLVLAGWIELGQLQGKKAAPLWRPSHCGALPLGLPQGLQPVLCGRLTFSATHCRRMDLHLEAFRVIGTNRLF